MGKKLFDVTWNIASLRGPEAAGLYKTVSKCNFT